MSPGLDNIVPIQSNKSSVRESAGLRTAFVFGAAGDLQDCLICHRLYSTLPYATLLKQNPHVSNRSIGLVAKGGATLEMSG